MKHLGRHVLAEICGCEYDILNDIKKVEEIMVNAALENVCSTNSVRKGSAVWW